MSSAYKTVSTEALNIITNLMPIDLRIKQVATEYHLKKNIRSDLVNHYFDNNVDLNLISRPIDFKKLPHPGVSDKISLTEDITADYFVYTNGYKNDNKVGSGFCVIENNNIIMRSKFKHANYCSQFQSQLFSVYKTLSYMKSKQYINKKVIVFGNMTTIKAIENSKSTNKLIYQIIVLYQELKSMGVLVMFANNYNSIHIEGEQESKNLSKAGSSAHRAIDYDVIPLNYIRKQIIDKNINQWNNRWINTTKGSITKKFIPTISFRLEIKKYFETNYELTQILTGHGTNNNYLFKYQLKDYKSCDRCGAEDETVEHIVSDCEELEEKRRELKHKAIEKYNSWPIMMKNLIDKKLFDYFKNFINDIFAN